MKYEQAGEYKVEYQAIDECGNETTAERNIIVTAPVTISSVLFDDGTFIINEVSINRANNIAEHGDVVSEYAPLDENNNYNFNGASQRLWTADIANIKSLEFGSEVKPVSIAFWFQSATNLESIDWTNFDGSEVMTARAFVASANITEFTLPPMPKLKNIRYICNACANLENVDMANVGARNIEDTVDAFQGCYALKTADISGLAGRILQSDRMFANVNGDGKGDMIIETIYANEDLLFLAGASTTSMFRSCTSLVGGNGTTFNANYTNYRYARIDTAEYPGYFTEKAV